MANIDDELLNATATPTFGLDDSSDEEKLIFPINVTESLAASGSLKKGERNGIIISFWVFGCFLIAWFLAGWLRNITPRWYVWIVLGVELLLQATVGVVLLRYILDERTMMAEASSADNSFAKFFGIYHEILSEEGSQYPFDIIEFADGSYGVYIQFLLGYNTNQISEATRELNVEVSKLINRSGMSYRVIYTNEHFSNSLAADELRQSVSHIQNPKLFTAYRDIVQGLLQIANEQSNVMSVTYLINAKTQIHKDELVQLVSNIMNLTDQAETVYREINVLNYEEIVEFYRLYYKLDVLDMGLVRAHQVQRKRISCSVKILKLYGKTGRVFNTPDFGALQRTILDADGLKRANPPKEH